MPSCSGSSGHSPGRPHRPTTIFRRSRREGQRRSNGQERCAPRRASQPAHHRHSSLKNTERGCHPQGAPEAHLSEAHAATDRDGKSIHRESDGNQQNRCNIHTDSLSPDEAVSRCPDDDRPARRVPRGGAAGRSCGRSPYGHPLRRPLRRGTRRRVARTLSITESSRSATSAARRATARLGSPPGGIGSARPSGRLPAVTGGQALRQARLPGDDIGHLQGQHVGSASLGDAWIGRRGVHELPGQIERRGAHPQTARRVI